MGWAKTPQPREVLAYPKVTPSQWQSGGTLVYLAYSTSPGTQVWDQQGVVLAFSPNALDVTKHAADLWNCHHSAHVWLLRESQLGALPDLRKNRLQE